MRAALYFLSKSYTVLINELYLFCFYNLNNSLFLALIVNGAIFVVLASVFTFFSLALKFVV